MLLAGTHTAIVAKCHDTSEAMIRKHYAASILDYTDEITRKTLPSLGPALQPAASGVGKLRSGERRAARRCGSRSKRRAGGCSEPDGAAMSVLGGKAEDICSSGAFQLLTQLRIWGLTSL
jgi:hypothetical protein